MRNVSVISEAISSSGSGTKEEVSVDDFLLRTPMFAHALLSFGVMPPIHVLNEILVSGCHDAGMSGDANWEPLELLPEEYDELFLSLCSNPEIEITEDRELWNRPTYEKWHGALLSKYARAQRGNN